MSEGGDTPPRTLPGLACTAAVESHHVPQRAPALVGLLLVALMPFIAAHLAYAVLIDAGHTTSGLPYLENCTSINRAARHGLGNLLFRLMMLPSALLLALH